jgi:hypothetical protein
VEWLDWQMRGEEVSTRREVADGENRLSEARLFPSEARFSASSESGVGRSSIVAFGRVQDARSGVLGRETGSNGVMLLQGW